MIHHAFTRRIVHGCGALLAALGLVQVAHAGYALPSPPPGWGGTTGAHTYQAANASQWLSGTVRTNAALNVAGKIINVPAALRVSANAASYFKPQLLANPYLLIGVTLAGIAADYYYDQELGQFVKPGLASSIYPSPFPDCESAIGWTYTSPYPDCDHVRQYAPNYWTRLNYAPNGCLLRGTVGRTYYASGWYCPVASTPRPLTPQEFEEDVIPNIPPEIIPVIFPDSPIPVTPPVINPAPDAPTVPRPLIVPMGDPQPIPNTNPPQWRQPVIQVSPAPTPSQPWQVDLVPRDVISSDPTPIREPAADPLPNGSTAPSEDADLCAKNPDILACQKPELDAPEVELPKDTVSITYTPENFGGGGGSCVAPVDISYFGHSARILDTDQACGWISAYLRPVALLVAAFISLGIVVGGLKTE